jgi:hypothetical protein
VLVPSGEDDFGWQISTTMLLTSKTRGEPYAPSRVFDERRLRAPLTPLPAREAASVRGTAKKEWKKMKRLLTALTTLYTETGFFESATSENPFSQQLSPVIPFSGTWQCSGSAKRYAK